jgi:AraC-like DNA-binding protein
MPQRVFGWVGLSENQMCDINEPIDLGSYVRMLELAAVDTGNDNFGLWFGQQFKPEMLGLIGAVAIASPNLGSGLASMARFFPYHQQATHTAFVCQGQWARLEYRIIDGGIVDRRHDAELTLGMFVNVLRHCLGATWTPEAIHFEHPRPSEFREHQQAFGAPVHFGQRTNALIFRSDRLGQPMPQGCLHRANAYCQELLRISSNTGVLSLLDHVKGEIRSGLPDGVPAIETVADAIGMPRWTLQRRLGNHGLSFSDAIDLVRRELAERHIRQVFVPVSDISHVLGYSELSAFSRAFRRWFGVSPQRFRAGVVAEQRIEHGINPH